MVIEIQDKTINLKNCFTGQSQFKKNKNFMNRLKLAPYPNNEQSPNLHFISDISK